MHDRPMRMWTLSRWRSSPPTTAARASPTSWLGSTAAAHGGRWVPGPVEGANQIVLLVLDGLGWEQLKARPLIAPMLSSMAGGAITSVAPSTTATALTSITTGLPPAAHEVVGYRVRVKGDAVLNVLRWRTAAGDARQDVDPTAFQTHPVFRGYAAPVVTRAEFAATGFTIAHLAGVRLHGWRMASSMPVQVADLLRAGEPFVYAYYDGVDKIAHERGFGPYYDAELQAADRLVSDLASLLPPGAVLVVTADHGQVEVDDQTIALGPEVLAVTRMVSGEGRFRWLHARPGCAATSGRAGSRAFGARGVGPHRRPARVGGVVRRAAHRRRTTVSATWP